MNCEQVHTFLDVYIDDEFDEPERSELEEHVTDCTDCRSIVTSERNFRRAFKEKLPPTPAPDHLRLAIVEQLEEQPTTGDTLPLLVKWVPLAVAAALTVVVIGPMLFGGEGPDPANISSNAANVGQTESAPSQAASPHVEKQGATLSYASLQGLKADVRGGEPHIRAYMASRVAFSVRAPFATGSGVALLGARQITAENRPAVMFIYAVDNERVNVIQMAATTSESANPALRIERRGTVSWAQWVQNGVRNTVVAELDPARVSHLIKTSR